MFVIAVSPRAVADNFAILFFTALALIIAATVLGGIASVGLVLTASLTTMFAPLTLAGLGALIAALALKGRLRRWGAILLGVACLGGTIWGVTAMGRTVDMAITASKYEELRRETFSLPSAALPDSVYYFRHADGIRSLMARLEDSDTPEHRAWRRRIDAKLDAALFSTGVLSRDAFAALDPDGEKSVDSFEAYRRLEALLQNEGAPRYLSFELACLSKSPQIDSFRRAACLDAAAIKNSFGLDLRAVLEQEHKELREFLSAAISGARDVYDYPSCLTSPQRFFDPRDLDTSAYGLAKPLRACPCPHYAKSKQNHRSPPRCRALPAAELARDATVRRVLQSPGPVTWVETAGGPQPSLDPKLCQLLATCRLLQMRGAATPSAIAEAWSGQK